MGIPEPFWCKEIEEYVVGRDNKKYNNESLDLEVEYEVERELHKVWLNESHKKDKQIDKVKESLIKLKRDIEDILKKLE